jgi:hypothetical protein
MDWWITLLHRKEYAEVGVFETPYDYHYNEFRLKRLHRHIRRKTNDGLRYGPQGPYN